MQVRVYKLLHAPVAVDSLAAWVRRYLEALAIAQFSKYTLHCRKSDLGIFYAWCEERSPAGPTGADF